jgi:hypothetical protein
MWIDNATPAKKNKIIPNSRRKEVGVKNKAEREHPILTIHNIKRQEQPEFFHVYHQSF